MFGQSTRSRASAVDIDEITRRLRLLERRLERAGGRASAGSAQIAETVTDAIVSALSGVASRFDANSIRDEAAKYGNEAARLGNEAVRRVSREVEHRPLVTLAVAIGLGILVGFVAHRR